MDTSHINSEPKVHRTITTGDVLVKKGEKYLLIRRSPYKIVAPNFATFIGGKIDEDEDPFVATQRELFEEAGLFCKNMKLVSVIMGVRPIKGQDENWLTFHFVADYDSGEVIPCEEGEFVWLTKEEIYEEKLFDDMRYIMPYMLDPAHGVVFLTAVWDTDSDRIIPEESILHICPV